MSLCSFVLSLCYEKCSQNQTQTTSKKKKQQSNSDVDVNSKQITAKEKVSLITEIMRNLKSALNTAENSLGKFFEAFIQREEFSKLKILSRTANSVFCYVNLHTYLIT